MALENFLQNAANFATGGLYNNLSGRDKELQQQQLAEAEAFRVNPELVREAAKYDPSIMERLGNLLTGGIYGQASGINDKLEQRAMAMKQIRDEELQRRMEDRMNQYRMGPVQEKDTIARVSAMKNTPAIPEPCFALVELARFPGNVIS